MPTKDKLNEVEATAILKALDDALDTGPWKDSNFLRVIGKSLKDIRDNFAKEIDDNRQSSDSALEKGVLNSERSGHKEVFIALYTADGSQLHSWERIVANLPRQIISRPVYAIEDDVKFLIKSKANKNNEAYVAIFVKESDMLQLSSDKIPIDKFGKELIALKDHAVHLENITRFVHISGNYSYSKGHLQKITE